MEHNQERREGIDGHADDFLRDIAHLENEGFELSNGQPQPVNTLDFSGRNPDSPWHATNELKLVLASERLAEIMKAMIKEEGVTDEARLKIFHKSAQDYLGRRTQMRNHVAELYLRARGGDAEYTKQALSQMYGRLKEAFVAEFRKPFTAGQPVQPARTVQRVEQPHPTQVKKRGGGIELDAATRRQLGYNQVDPANLRDKHQAYGTKNRTREIDKRTGTG